MIIKLRLRAPIRWWVNVLTIKEQTQCWTITISPHSNNDLSKFFMLPDTNITAHLARMFSTWHIFTANVTLSIYSYNYNIMISIYWHISMHSIQCIWSNLIPTYPLNHLLCWVHKESVLRLMVFRWSFASTLLHTDDLGNWC